jgi:hypothetical protein
VNDYRELYTQVCESYRAIDDFRMKLLALLPVATGAGVLVLLNSGKVDLNATGSDLDRMQLVLAGIAIFGVATQVRRRDDPRQGPPGLQGVAGMHLRRQSPPGRRGRRRSRPARGPSSSPAAAPGSAVIVAVVAGDASRTGSARDSRLKSVPAHDLDLASES